jgi:hypothetical protein
MAASRNRGKKKAKLRDYSHLSLTKEEKQTVAAIAHSVEQNPMVTAILGAILVEHELDNLLRPKFKNLDDDEWKDLQNEQGPLRSFSAKISIGRALNIYDKKLKNDLDVVRVVRNAFAHSRKLLEFTDPLIAQEMMQSHYLPKRFKNELREEMPNTATAKAAYIVICLRIQIVLLTKGSRAAAAKNYRMKKKIATSPLRNALLGNPPYPMSGIAGLAGMFKPPPNWQGLLQQSPQDGQTSDPNPSIHQGFAEALRPFLDDNEK